MEEKRGYWRAAAAVTVGLALLTFMPQLLLRRVQVANTLFWLVETCALIPALSLHYWLARSHSTVLRFALCSAAIAAGWGAINTNTYFFVVGPALGIEFEHARSLSPAGASAYGAFMGLFQCGAWALAFAYPMAARTARLHALEAENLRLEAEQLRTSADLALLRSQLEPHFLLNSLNAVAGLVTHDAHRARRLLGCLGDLLRDSLADAHELHTLDQEIAWLQRYAEILETRYAGTLQFRWDIADEARTALIPRLLLQPLIENAVNHGVLPVGAGTVTVRALLGDQLAGERAEIICSVEDTGRGLQPAHQRAGALGLKMVQRRLDAKYLNASLRLESAATGTRSLVRFPRIVEPVNAAPKAIP